MALTRKQLDTTQCACCTAEKKSASHTNALFLIGRCHPQAGANVVYNKETHNIEVSCHECGDSWHHLTCIDRLLELGELKEITPAGTVQQHRVFVART